MKSVGGAQRRLRQAQEQVLRPTVNIPRQLDAVVHTLVEAPEDGVPAPYGRRSATRIPADGAESGVMVASAPSVSIAA